MRRVNFDSYFTGETWRRKNQIICTLFLPVVLGNEGVGTRGACGAVGAMFPFPRG